MGRRLNTADLDYIRLYAATKTDKQLAEEIGCSVRTIENQRKKLGLSKKDGVLKVEPVELPENEDDQSWEFIVAKFKRSSRGRKLRTMLSQDDFDVFVEEWASYNMQFEDLTHTELSTVEHMILLKLRILQNQKEVAKTLEQKSKLSGFDLTSFDMDDEEQTQKFHKLQALDSHLNDLNKEYRELLDKANQLFKSLSGTREQREKKGNITRETFFTLCDEFSKKKTREKEGRFAELLRLSMEKNSDRLREAIEFADGTISPQLLDATTVELTDKQDANSENSNKDNKE
jgi:hypothetical protein